jgi:hypothetical protein
MNIKYNITLLLAVIASLNVSAKTLRPEIYCKLAPDSGIKSSLPLIQKEKDGGYKPHSVIKLNLSQLAIKNISLQYEFAFHKNMSISCGGSYFLSRSLPGLFTKDDPSGQGLRSPVYSGFAITPEFRFYPGRKETHQAPHGFYFALYFRYAKYKLTSEYYDMYNNQTYGYNLTATYGGATGGLMLGYQWLIGKHISIDFWIIGGGFGQAKFALNAVTQGVSISPDEQNNIRQVLQDELSGANFLNASNPVIETTDHSVKATMSRLPMVSPRGLGLCFGFAF